MAEVRRDSVVILSDFQVHRANTTSSMSMLLTTNNTRELTFFKKQNFLLLDLLEMMYSMIVLVMVRHHAQFRLLHRYQSKS